MARDFDTQPELNSLPDQWHGVDQYLGSPEFAKMIQDEFPEDAAEWLDPVTRRQFVTLMGASLVLAGAAGCNPSLKPASQKKILPYVKKPDANVTGVPLFFTSAFSLAGVGLGVLVKSHEGRPIKVEGNPSHPSSLGSTDLFAQASVLGLYDPDRSQIVTEAGNPSTWDKAKAALIRVIEKAKIDKGASLRIVTGAHSSPTLAVLMAELKAILPQVKWIQYETIARDNILKGSQLAFGKYLSPVYDFAQANVVVSIDSDFLSARGPGEVRYTRDAASRRKLRMSHDAKKGDGVSLDRLSRIYAVESAPTNTGASADHRLPMKPSEVESFVRELARELGVAGTPASGPLSADARTTIKHLVTDLKNAKGAAAVIAGDHLSAVGHALVFAINHAIGAVGKTVNFIEPTQIGLNGPDADAVADSIASLKSLTQDMKAGKVENLLLLGVNPLFDAPADLDFASSLSSVKGLKFHLGAYVDETAIICDWHIPEAHYLETWSDVRAHDGTVAIGQPLIAPLHGGRSILDFVATLLTRETGDPYQLVLETWQKLHTAKKIADAPADFEVFWHHCLERGFIAGTASARVDAGAPKLAEEVTKAPAPVTVADEIEIAFRADPTLYDGRFANNGWLQELPKPLTRLTWDNAAIVSPATADKLGCGIDYSGWTRGNFPLSPGTGGENGRTEAQMIELTVAGKKVKLPVFVMPGAADDVITLHLGYGRTRVGKVGEGTGFNVYPLRTSTALWSTGGIAPGKNAVRTGEKYLLACTQGQHAMEGRRPSRWGNVVDVKREEDQIDNHTKHVFSFADNPPVAGAEKDLIRSNLPGTPEEIERLAKQYPGKYVNNIHTHGDQKEHEHEHDARLVPLSLIGDVEKNKLYRRWAMAIDLGACTGCSACVIACVAENNIPVVGKAEVIRGRIMHWIRLDRYFATTAEAGGTKKVAADVRYDQLKANTAAVTTHFQPLPCQQCEKAPCELVCPVNATVHSADGLNDMVYNRCVGTRYCANNCPYKVRRFNFLQYANYKENSLSLVNNPEVTVRTRGVMEKCTYCVQRIRLAEIEAEREHDNPARPKDEKSGRPIIKEGEVRTACQAACPAQAIAFGDLNNDQYMVNGKSLGFSQVSRWKLEPTHYGLLSELNTMPRTSYLAAVKNPNPELVAALSASKGA